MMLKAEMEINKGKGFIGVKIVHKISIKDQFTLVLQDFTL